MTKQETRSRILAAAAELFGERGYVGTTTSAIADAAGVNEVTLFRHFESKLGIVRALGATLDSSGALGVFTALVTDTGWFRFGSTTHETFQWGGKLVAPGASPAAIFAEL